jgi:hypothetical protein
MAETKLKKALYLDDQRTPTTILPGYEPWVIVRNFEEFQNYILGNGVPDMISFDHDLGEEHYHDYANQVSKMGWQAPDYDHYKTKTGYDCAKWLCDYIEANPALDWKLRYCQVHSHNPVGATNIQGLINAFKKYKEWDQDCFLGKVAFTIENQ